MIYATFAVWMILIISAGMGVQWLWRRLISPGWVSWALLPGTIVSEMSYIFGCLITGGEIRRARIMPDMQEKDKEPQAPTEAAPKLRLVGPIVASLICIAACGAGIIISNQFFGQEVISKFEASAPLGVQPTNEQTQATVQQALPGDWNSFWNQLEGQVRLIRRTLQAWGGLDWLQWHVPLFVYLVVCLAVRMAPAGRPFVPTLLAVVLIAGVIRIVGLMNTQFENIMQNLWPLLTYVWSTLLLLLVISLLLHAIVGVGKSMLDSTASGPAQGGKKSAKADA